MALTFNLPGKLSVARTAVLKHTLRSVHRMMQSSGTSEGLRGLLDSSLLKSIKKIMQHRAIFGPSALALGKIAPFLLAQELVLISNLCSCEHYGYLRPQ